MTRVTQKSLASPSSHGSAAMLPSPTWALSVAIALAPLSKLASGNAASS